MPSYYAHYKFAEEVLAVLPHDLKTIAERNKTLYLTGSHGPDIFFYYKPLRKNAVNELGSRMHDAPAAPFFADAREVINSSKNKDAASAYIMGFITHFVLDSACHGYVAEKMRESGVSHTAVETDFDRELMVADGLDPLRVKPVDYVKAEKEYAEVIAPFFSLKAEEIVKSLASMKRCDSIMIAKSRLKRFLIRVALVLAGKYKYMGGLIMTPSPNPECADSSAKLKELMLSEITNARDLMIEYFSDVTTLNSRFDRNYE